MSQKNRVNKKKNRPSHNTKKSSRITMWRVITVLSLWSYYCSVIVETVTGEVYMFNWWFAIFFYLAFQNGAEVIIWCSFNRNILILIIIIIITNCYYTYCMIVFACGKHKNSHFLLFYFTIKFSLGLILIYL